MSGDDYFDRWHEDGDEAFGILQDGLQVPPSVEVFEHGLELKRAKIRQPLKVQWYARQLVEDPGVEGVLVDRVALAFRDELDRWAVA